MKKEEQVSAAGRRANFYSHYGNKGGASSEPGDRSNRNLAITLLAIFPNNS